MLSRLIVFVQVHPVVVHRFVPCRLCHTLACVDEKLEFKSKVKL
jgi:hypothetical protein